MLYGIITSGHAVRQNDFVYMNGELVGVAQNTQQWGTIDAAFVTSSSNIITTNYIAGTRNVLSTIISEPGENTIINKCGFRTGITSGRVVSTRASVTSFGHTITNVTSATYDSEQGDSGGVVYSYISSTNTRYTVGVHLGSDGTYAYYSKANEINYAFNTNRY